jgi:AbrB family looped-hinge helix DNA binding protein
MSEPKPPGSRARETSPSYRGSSESFSVLVAERGRLVLPAAVRERLNIRAGDTLTLTLEADGAMVLHTPMAAVARLRGAFKHLSPDRRAVDELIAERRREVAADERASVRAAKPRGRRR